MNLVERTEGLVRILAPPVTSTRGPISTSPIFYNPAMAPNRDMTICVLEHLSVTEWKARSTSPPLLGDVMAATGVRGIRMAVELGIRPRVLINEANPEAVDVIVQNLRLNDIDIEEDPRVEVTNTDCRRIMTERPFDFIDLDPYGSPAPFLDPLVAGAGQDRYVVGVTATDTAVLCGSKLKACVKRYDARPMRCPYMAEVALRILIGAIVRRAASLDKAFIPFLCNASDHYVRVYGRLDADGDKDALLAMLGHITFDRSTVATTVLPGVDQKIKVKPPISTAGPLWLGPLFDPGFVEGLTPLPHMMPNKALEKIISLWREEARAPPFYYTVDSLGSHFKGSPPRISELIEALRAHGRVATRTHITPIGFRTDASHDEVLDIFKAMMPPSR